MYSMDIVQLNLFFYIYIPVKFLNFRTPENFAVILKKRFYHRVMHPRDSDSIANNEGLDQTAPLGAV